MGEGGAIAPPGAIVNAVADALAPFDVKFTELPLTPNRVWDTIREARQKQSNTEPGSVSASRYRRQREQSGMSVVQDRDPAKVFCSVEAVQNAFLSENYLAERPLAMTIMLAAQLGKPILLKAKRELARLK